MSHLIYRSAAIPTAAFAAGIIALAVVAVMTIAFLVNFGLGGIL